MKKTIQEWAKDIGYVVLDPDGFDRKDPNLMIKKITKEEFDRGFIYCTIMKITNQPKNDRV